ncbi:hypothetical protein AB0B63_18520 [Micromonospora sp. NPDC049081]|uniref:hypothetical protein n=1 Tax=Micromonospora sp. NPDC049081 TaxID=3155150 RepID=UPI0033C63356
MVEQTLTRARLPFVGRRGDTVEITADGRIRFNTRILGAVDALELSAALARAVNDTNHTPTKGA